MLRWWCTVVLWMGFWGCTQPPRCANRDQDCPEGYSCVDQTCQPRESSTGTSSSGGGTSGMSSSVAGSTSSSGGVSSSATMTGSSSSGVSAGSSVGSSAQVSSGMGSSSSFTVGLLHALHGLRGEMRSKAQLLDEALHVEQDLLRETVGSQDQAAAAHGGLNTFVFEQSGEITARRLILSAERMAEFAKGIERDPQLEQHLRLKSKELGIELQGERSLERELTKTLTLERSRNFGMSL